MQLLRQFLYFTKPQLRGVIALIALIFLVAIAPRVYYYFNPPKFSNDEQFLKEVREFENAATIQKDSSGSN